MKSSESPPGFSASARCLSSSGQKRGVPSIRYVTAVAK